MSVARVSGGASVAARAPWSGANRAGLVVGLLYQAFNVVGFLLPTGDAAQPGPPLEILVTDSVLAVVGIVLFLIAWFSRRRLFARLGVALVVIVALSAFPAFFVPGIPVPIRMLAAGEAVVAVVSSILVLLPARGSAARS